MAVSGVASANLDKGSRTIGNNFRTNRADAGEDLTGVDLDNLVEELQHVELILIVEMSTCDVASLEVVIWWMKQVARVVWRRKFNMEPPPGRGSFGGVGVVLLGEFAQNPLVLATSLMHGLPLVEKSGDSQ